MSSTTEPVRNELIDYRVYNQACMKYLGFDELTDDEWLELLEESE